MSGNEIRKKTTITAPKISTAWISPIPAGGKNVSRSTCDFDACSSSTPPITAASVEFWMMLTSRLTNGGRRRRNACGRITNRWRPTQPKPSANAASCCSRGIDPTAPRVASATCALPQRMSAIAVDGIAPNFSDAEISGSPK